MINPSVMEQLGRQRGREILETSGTTRTTESVISKAKERLGWSLIGLGAHLALPRRRQSSWRPLTGS